MPWPCLSHTSGRAGALRYYAVRALVAGSVPCYAGHTLADKPLLMRLTCTLSPAPCAAQILEEMRLLVDRTLGQGDEEEAGPPPPPA